jgi:hypothetical protein
MEGGIITTSILHAVLWSVDISMSSNVKNGMKGYGEHVYF